MSRYKWQRKEYTTKGSDPTLVVIWKCEDYEITEFQNVYSVQNRRGKDLSGKLAVMAEELHKALEATWTSKLENIQEEWDRNYRP